MVTGINIDRLADGRIVEHWGEANTVGMLAQLGMRFVPDDKWLETTTLRRANRNLRQFRTFGSAAWRSPLWVAMPTVDAGLLTLTGLP